MDLTDLTLDEFDLTPREKAIRVNGHQYVVREASAQAAAAYRNALLKGANVGEDGKVKGIGDMADADVVLLAHCLYRSVPNPDGQTVGDHPVPVAEVRRWPDRVTRPLIDLVKKMSDMEPEKETVEFCQRQITHWEGKRKALLFGGSPVKNGSGATTGSSA